MDNQKILGEAPIGKLLFQYSAPAIVSFLVNACGGCGVNSGCNLCAGERI